MRQRLSRSAPYLALAFFLVWFSVSTDLVAAGGGPYGRVERYFMGPVGTTLCAVAACCALRGLWILTERPNSQ